MKNKVMTDDQKSSPNIIWIFGDQHRAQALGYMGDPNVRTPNIDSMAAQGITFKNAISGCPWCSPFRGALLTGQYIHRAVQKSPQRLDSSLPTVAEAFRKGGYHTAWFGKWHLDGGTSEPDNHYTTNSRGEKIRIVPPERRGGFDEWVGYENFNQHAEATLHTGSAQEPELVELDQFETDGITDMFLKHLQERKEADKPFFSAMSVTPPHDPYFAPEEEMRHYNPASLKLRRNVPPVARIEAKARRELAGYYGMIENLDRNVGRIIQALRKMKLLDNTIVFFFSDHGDMHGSHGYFLKSSPWEEAIRIPCVVTGGDISKTFRSSQAPVNHVDFASTSLGLAGLDIPENFQGSDFSSEILKGEEKPKELPTSAYIQQCVRKSFGHCNDRTWRGVRTVDGWKYVCLENQPLMMFNLNEDPYELANLAYQPEYRKQRQELTEQIQTWIRRTGDQFSLPEV